MLYQVGILCPALKLVNKAPITLFLMLLLKEKNESFGEFNDFFIFLNDQKISVCQKNSFNPIEYIFPEYIFS